MTDFSHDGQERRTVANNIIPGPYRRPHEKPDLVGYFYKFDPQRMPDEFKIYKSDDPASPNEYLVRGMSDDEFGIRILDKGERKGNNMPYLIEHGPTVDN